MTNQQNNDKSIGIHYIGLEARELSIFDRVVAFNVTHGLVVHNTTDYAEAELIIINQDNFSEIESYSHSNKTIFMVCDSSSDNNSDAQIQRPLLITKVMNTLGEAIDAVKQKRSTSTPEPEQISSASAALGSNLSSDHQETVDPLVANNISTLEATAENREMVNSEVVDSKAEKNDDEIITKEVITNTEAAETNQTGHHALVIDDSASIRKQLELELRDAGITSDFADSGETALEKIKEGQFDLIFLDIIMPGIDGYETCKQMRATAEYKKTPIIMLSGKTSPLDEVQGVIAGATTYLTKPVKSDRLQETLNRVTKWIDNFSQSKKTETA